MIRETVLAFAVAAPVVVTTLAVLFFSALELRGRTPLSYGPVQNIAEAAALGHASEVLRLLSAGQDPNRVWTVRRDIISSNITEVTALEAAIWSRREQMIELLDRQGAIVGHDVRRHLACLAADVPNPVDEIVKYLSPEHREGDCVPGETLARVVERSAPR